jgi:hypothetical protein
VILGFNELTPSVDSHIDEMLAWSSIVKLWFADVASGVRLFEFKSLSYHLKKV